MARRPATPEQRAAQRNVIRRAAADVYREGGMQAVSARAVAERAGVSTGTLYSYFDSLPHLMRSLWTASVARANEEIAEAARRAPDPIARIRAILETYASFVLANQDVHRGALLYVRPAAVDRPEVEPLDDVPLFIHLRDALKAAHDEGLVRAADAGDQAQVLWAGVHGALALPVNVERWAVADAEVLVAEMIEALLRSLSP